MFAQFSIVMNTDIQSHQLQIQRAGKILWGFSWFWLIFNFIAFIIVGAMIIGLGIAGASGSRDEIVKTFAQSDLVPGLNAEISQQILAWDFAGYMDHIWLTTFYILFAASYFVLTMALILKIAARWKRGDVFGPSPIRTFRLLGWIYLIHGIIGQAWGMIGQFAGESNTSDVVYFSFIRDVGLMAFSTSGTGIEWGLLCLALSWILQHAKHLNDEQQLVV